MRKRILMCMSTLLLCNVLMSQTKTITGRVVDELNAPVASASILVAGTTSGVTSDNDGTFSITIHDTSKSLIVSAIGFVTTTYQLGTSNVIQIILRSDKSAMEEVVVTGLTSGARDRFAGTVSKITENQIRHQPVGSFDQILQGKAPGVLAQTSSGQPGTNTRIIIRGTSSINGSSSPLFIVDGIQVEEGAFQSLDPNDFASIDIFRDAISSALYGSRGSGGVIVVTTKKGIAGKNTITATSQVGTKQKPEYAFRPMNTDELLTSQETYGNIVRPGRSTAQALTIPGWYYSPNNPFYQTLSPAQQAEYDYVLDSLRQINTNWADYFFQNGSFGNHQLTLSGGTGRTRYYSSLGYYNEEGTTPRTWMKRGTFRNNIDFASDRFTMSVNTNIGYTTRSFQQSTTTNGLANPFLAVNIAPPYIKPYNSDGTFNSGQGAIYTGPNVLDLTHFDRNFNDQIKITASFAASYKITSALKAALTAGVDFRETQNTNYGSPLAYNRKILNNDPNSASFNKASTGFQSESLARVFMATLRPTLQFTKTLGDKHDLDLSINGEFIPEFSKSFGLTGYGTDVKRPNTPAAMQNGNATNKLFSEISGGKNRNSIISGFFVGNYTYDNKYTLNVSARRDGSSKLHKDHKFQDFYAAGLVWHISREDFFKDISFVDDLRLKASYGNSGNHNNFPSNWGFLATYVEGNYAGIPTISVSSPGNPNLLWEAVSTLNLGVDFSLFEGKFTGDINWYDRITTDLFVSRALTPESGFGSLNVNAGKLRNRGVEVVMNYDVVRTKDLLVQLHGNVSYNKNVVLDLGGESSYEVGTSLITVGLPLGTHYEVKWGGIDASNGRPLYYTKDGKLTNVYNADDAVQEFGTWESPWKGGFGSQVIYKNFTLNVLFSWQQGGTKMDNLEYFVENPVGFLHNGYNQSSSLNYWQQPGDIASTPSPLYGTNFSSKLIHKTDFLRLRDLSLSYNIKRGLLSDKAWIQDAKIFVQCMNVFILTNWRGMDPEAGPANINLSEFPNPRSLTLGLSLSF